mmetsp:Transcript_13509/g.36084  ORF Transcript_13509/g.36084 Transcript_13509/m.36084 type:complete len:245 (-) Transcript_13509:2013-2747(-)
MYLDSPLLEPSHRRRILHSATRSCQRPRRPRRSGVLHAGPTYSGSSDLLHGVLGPGGHLLGLGTLRLASLAEQYLDRLVPKRASHLCPERVREVSDDAHRGARYRVVALRVSRNHVEEDTDVVYVGEEEVSLSVLSQALQDARIGLQDALAQLIEVVDHVVVVHVHLCLRGCGKHLHSDAEVLFEMAGDSERNVAKDRQHRRLDVAVEAGILQVLHEEGDQLITVGCDARLERAAAIANDAHGH